MPLERRCTASKRVLMLQVGQPGTIVDTSAGAGKSHSCLLLHPGSHPHDGNNPPSSQRITVVLRAVAPQRLHLSMAVTAQGCTRSPQHINLQCCTVLPPE